MHPNHSIGLLIPDFLSVRSVLPAFNEIGVIIAEKIVHV